MNTFEKKTALIERMLEALNVNGSQLELKTVRDALLFGHFDDVELDFLAAAVQAHVQCTAALQIGPVGPTAPLVSPRITQLLIGYRLYSEPSMRKHRVNFPMDGGVCLCEVWSPDTTGVYGYQRESSPMFSTDAIVEMALRAILRGARPKACSYASCCAVELGELRL